MASHVGHGGGLVGAGGGEEGFSCGGREEVTKDSLGDVGEGALSVIGVGAGGLGQVDHGWQAAIAGMGWQLNSCE